MPTSPKIFSNDYFREGQSEFNFLAVLHKESECLHFEQVSFSPFGRTKNFFSGIVAHIVVGNLCKKRKVVLLEVFRRWF